MAMVEFDWTLQLPNEYMVDHTFTDGNTRTCTYDGPDKIYLLIDNETGKEAGGPITAIEKADGRPAGLNMRWVEVDCFTNPLICELRAPVIDEYDEDYTDDTHPPGVIDIEGFNTCTYQTPLRPDDVWDWETIHVDEDDNITIQPRTKVWALMGSGDRMPTWDDLRAKRDVLLKNSDSEITDDMPESLKEKWRAYRQKLRDWPSIMADAGIPAHFAYTMQPIDPASEAEPEDGSKITI